jgi:hypothetical protein
MDSEIARLGQAIVGMRLDVITQIDAHAVTRENLAEQQGASVAVPEGYALVPVEPPVELEQFVCNCDVRSGAAAGEYPEWQQCYRAMIAAAPSPARLNQSPVAPMPEQEGSIAQKSFWAGYEAARLDPSSCNIRNSWNEFKASEQFARLNPPADGVAPTQLTVWFGPMPESNGKSNYTAILHRVGECMSEGITIHRSEYPDRARYEADEVRYLLGELTGKPCILDYDADKHSGYTTQQPAPSPVSGLVEAQYDPYPHGHPLHKEVFMALSVYGGGDTFEDGVRGLIAELKEIRAAYKAQGGDSDE